jgi:mannose-1-phosphate guanylyltransferase/mannose-6-phosphate isomerase
MAAIDLPVYPVLLAGGSGTRLWPVSRELHPKQLAKLIGRESLIQSTVRRLCPPFAPERLRVVCGGAHLDEIARHMEEVGVPAAGKIICEPCGRNTAPAVLLAVLHILATEKDAVLGIFPADHVIGDPEAFHARLAQAVELAAQGHIVTFGITPDYPETGYGYVEGGEEVAQGALRIRRFVEKPDLEVARGYLAAGNFFWNSGMFAFKASVIVEEFSRHQPQILEALRAMAAPGNTMRAEDYRRLPDASIDIAIMERTARGVVLPSNFGWSDIGSWKSLYDFLPKDSAGNVLAGDVIARQTRNTFVLGSGRLVAVNHLENLVVVETPDSIFISDIEHSRDVKDIFAVLKANGRTEHHRHRTVYFPWGTRALLEGSEEHRVCRLQIYPGSVSKTLEPPGAAVNLFVLGGRAKFSCGRRRRELGAGESLTVTANGEVRIENPAGEPLQLIETVLHGVGRAAVAPTSGKPA